MDEIPESILEQAREELMEQARNELTFDTVIDALAELSEGNQKEFVRLIMSARDDENTLLGQFAYVYVISYIRPSNEEVQDKAVEILAERDYQNGKRK